MKIINAQPGMSQPMTEDETKNFMANNNNLLMHIGTIDDLGEPNVIVTAFYFDNSTYKIYITTQKNSKKVEHLKNKNTIGFSVDDPNPPFKGVRGKGTVKILENVNQNIALAKKIMTKVTGSLDNPISKWLMSEVGKGNEIILEITPRYFSTWRRAIPEKFQ